MAIPFTCSCKAQYRLKDQLAGKKTKCPKCGRIIEVPSATASEPRISEGIPAILPDEQRENFGDVDFRPGPEAPIVSTGSTPSSQKRRYRPPSKTRSKYVVLFSILITLIGVGSGVFFIYFGFSQMNSIKKANLQSEKSILDFVGHWGDESNSGFTFDADGRGTGFFQIPNNAKKYFNGAAGIWTGQVQIKQQANRFSVTVAKDHATSLGPFLFFLHIDKSNKQLTITEERSGVHWLCRKVDNVGKNPLGNLFQDLSIDAPVYMFPK